jgi:hypothetical protein
MLRERFYSIRRLLHKPVLLLYFPSLGRRETEANGYAHEHDPFVLCCEVGGCGMRMRIREIGANGKRSVKCEV